MKAGPDYRSRALPLGDLCILGGSHQFKELWMELSTEEVEHHPFSSFSLQSEIHFNPGHTCLQTTEEKVPFIYDMHSDIFPFLTVKCW